MKLAADVRVELELLWVLAVKLRDLDPEKDAAKVKAHLRGITAVIDTVEDVYEKSEPGR